MSVWAQVILAFAALLLVAGFIASILDLDISRLILPKRERTSALPADRTESPGASEVAKPAKAPPASISVPRPEWFRIDSVDGRSFIIAVTMTSGEIAVATMDLHAIGHRPALAGFRNALQMAARMVKR